MPSSAPNVDTNTPRTVAGTALWSTGVLPLSCATDDNNSVKEWECVRSSLCLQANVAELGGTDVESRIKRTLQAVTDTYDGKENAMTIQFWDIVRISSGSTLVNGWGTQPKMTKVVKILKDTYNLPSVAKLRPEMGMILPVAGNPVYPPSDLVPVLLSQSKSIPPAASPTTQRKGDSPG